VGSLYAGAAGKVLLSQLKDEEVKLILERINFIKLTPKTVTDKEALMDEIHQIREQGYATSFGERVLGVGGLTVPVRNYVYPAALSILGPEERLAANMRVFVTELRKSARKISQNLKENQKII
jgi:IclR family transcriptional regulator, KDG regulon repressor